MVLWSSSTGSCSGLKASQKTGQRLKVSSPTDWEKPGMEPSYKTNTEILEDKK